MTRTVALHPPDPPGALVRQDRREVRAVGFVPAETKFRRPHPRPGLVIRTGLLECLRASAHVPVVVVTAPAGYGKTTLLAQWADADERPFAWVSLDARDRDPAVLITYVALALHRVERVDVPVLAGITEGSTRISTSVLPRLGRTLARRQRSFVLVLDDVHVLEGSPCREVLTVLADHLPAGSQLLLVSRTAPPLPLGRLRAHRRLREIGADDLALTVPEGDALLRSAGVRLEREDVEALVARTEGWPAGLYLAALTLAGVADQRAAVSAVAGDDRLITDYLRDELLNEAPPELVEFLTRTSVLERLCGPLCDAVLQRQGCGVVLQELQRSNLFLVPLDRRCEWYRYHQLFASMLRAELHRREPEREVELHRRAAHWHAAQGNLDQAIGHARAAGDVRWAARVIWPEVASYLTSGRRATLERWLSEFTFDQIRAEPELGIAAAWCALQTGRSPDLWIEVAERAAHDAPPGAVEWLRAALAVTRAARASDGLRRMRADAELADRLLPAGDGWRVPALLLIGVADHLTGDRVGARHWLEEAAQLCVALQMPSPQTICLAQLALLAVAENDWQRAAALTAEALSLVQQHGLSEIATLGPSYAVFALVLAHNHEVEQAQRYARHARRMISLATHFAPWLAIQARVVLAQAHAILGDSIAARILLSEAQRLLRQSPDAPVLQARLEEGWQMVEMLPLATRSGPSALTTAELRVLQFLPTHLSFQEIGNRLYLSRNTIKTHAVSAYRKLGVNSRNEAVERAHLLGLIDT